MTDDRRPTIGRTHLPIRNLQFIIRNLLWWTFAALIAIALGEINALLGLGVAIVGGIILGILLFVK